MEVSLENENNPKASNGPYSDAIGYSPSSSANYSKIVLIRRAALQITAKFICRAALRITAEVILIRGAALQITATVYSYSQSSCVNDNRL